MYFLKNNKKPFDETRQRFQVRGGTLEKLIERLTYPKYPDPEYLLTFLMTYRSFCTPKQLFDLLLQRFYSPLPINCLEEDLKKFFFFFLNYIQRKQLKTLLI